MFFAQELILGLPCCGLRNHKPQHARTVVSRLTCIVPLRLARWPFPLPTLPGQQQRLAWHARRTACLKAEDLFLQRCLALSSVAYPMLPRAAANWRTKPKSPNLLRTHQLGVLPPRLRRRKENAQRINQSVLLFFWISICCLMHTLRYGVPSTASESGASPHGLVTDRIMAYLKHHYR